MKSKMAVSLFIALSLIQLVLGSTVYVYESPSDGNYFFKSFSQGQKISQNGLAATVCQLLKTDVPFQVTSDIASELESVLVSNVFDRPGFVWTLHIKTQDSSIASELGFANAGLDVLSSSYVDTVKAFADINRNNAIKLDTNIPSVTEVEEFINGVGGLDPNERLVKFWAVDILQALTRLEAVKKSMAENSGSVLYEDTTLIGLAFLEMKYGIESAEFKAAKAKTVALLNSAKSELEAATNGKFIFIYIALTKSTVPNFAVSAPVVQSAGVNSNSARRATRRLRQATVDQSSSSKRSDVKLFSKHAAAYAIFLVILFASLGGIYSLSNMSFKKDTLLYSSVKFE